MPRLGADTPPEQTPPAQCMLGDMGNKRVVLILLECILVLTVHLREKLKLACVEYEGGNIHAFFCRIHRVASCTTETTTAWKSLSFNTWQLPSPGQQPIVDDLFSATRSTIQYTLIILLLIIYYYDGRHGNCPGNRCKLAIIKKATKRISNYLGQIKKIPCHTALFTRF